MANDPDTVESFLTYLAKHANPDRFFPFPDAYRVDPKTNDPALSERFQPYSQNDKSNVMNALVNIQADINAKLREYIVNIPMQMAFHGTSIHPNIIEYQFKYDPIKERLRDNISSKRWYLFHGSSLSNWHSIIRNGIRNMSQTSLMSHGASIGNGVYLTNDLQTAAGYSDGRIKCVAVVELFEDPAKYQKNNSGVYVIPNDKLLIPRYLYKMKKIIMLKSTPVLDYYKKQKDASLSRKVPARRIMYEMKDIGAIPSLVVLSAGETNLVVVYKSVMIEILIQGFPYKQPIIRSVYELDKKLDKFDDQMIYLFDWLPSHNLSSVFMNMDLSGANMTNKEIILNYDY